MELPPTLASHCRSPPLRRCAHCSRSRPLFSVRQRFFFFIPHPPLDTVPPPIIGSDSSRLHGSRSKHDGATMMGGSGSGGSSSALHGAAPCTRAAVPVEYVSNCFLIPVLCWLCLTVASLCCPGWRCRLVPDTDARTARRRGGGPGRTARVARAVPRAGSGAAKERGGGGRGARDHGGEEGRRCQ